MKHLRLGL